MTNVLHHAVAAVSNHRTHPRYMKLNQKSSMREDRMSQPWMN